MVISDTHPHTYTVGEEVVVSLHGVDLYETEHMMLIPRPLVPEWTIARIASIVHDGPCPSYLLHTELRTLHCICRIDEDRIEGTA